MTTIKQNIDDFMEEMEKHHKYNDFFKKETVDQIFFKVNNALEKKKLLDKEERDKLRVEQRINDEIRSSPRMLH